MAIVIGNPTIPGTLVDVIGHWGEAPAAPAMPSRPVALVPTAEYQYDSVTNLWLPAPYGGGGGGGGPVRENEYWMSRWDLGPDNPVFVEVLHPPESLSGWSLTVWRCSGQCEIAFDSAAHDPIPLRPFLLWPMQITFQREFSRLYIRHPPQPGRFIEFYVGRRV